MFSELSVNLLTNDQWKLFFAISGAVGGVVAFCYYCIAIKEHWCNRQNGKSHGKDAIDHDKDDMKIIERVLPLPRESHPRIGVGNAIVVGVGAIVGIEYLLNQVPQDPVSSVDSVGETDVASAVADGASAAADVLTGLFS